MEIGKNYKVSHSRKGVFEMKVNDVSGEWVTGIITSGYADAICDHNEVWEGEEITIRISLASFIETPLPNKQ